MKRIPVISLKGGTGKSTVTANLGLALRDMRYKVGFMDTDISGANLPSALGHTEPPPLDFETGDDAIVPWKGDGYELFSLASFFGKAAVLWKGAENTIKVEGRDVLMKGTGRYALVKQMIATAGFSPDLDFLLVDTPPVSGDEMLSLWDWLPDIWGTIMVCQPTVLAVEDIERTLDMLGERRIPVLGLVGNMSVVVCPACGHRFEPFLDPASVTAFCERSGVPFLGLIPFCLDKTALADAFHTLALKVLAALPVKPWETPFKARVERALLKTFVTKALGDSK